MIQTSTYRIGVISDTHGMLDPRILSLFEKVDHVLHAGDVGKMSVLRGLEGLAPVTAVRGNVDDGFISPDILPTRVVILSEIKILMTHVLGDPHRLERTKRIHVREASPDIVVYGHTHQPFNEFVEGILYFNPGSAGPRRFNLPRSVGFLEIQNGTIRSRIVNL